MIALGGATSVVDYQQLEAWFKPLVTNEEHRVAVSEISKDYTAKNQGATELIYKTLFK